MEDTVSFAEFIDLEIENIVLRRSNAAYKANATRRKTRAVDTRIGLREANERAEALAEEIAARDEEILALKRSLAGFKAHRTRRTRT